MIDKLKQSLSLVFVAALLYAIESACVSLFGTPGVSMAFALAAYSGQASYDQADSHFLDLSDVLSSILLADTFFLGRVSMGEAHSQTIFYWNEDALNATVVTCALSKDASETSFVLGSGHGARLRIGALLLDEAIGQTEVMQVTDISTDTITVTRGFGASAPAGQTHLAGASYRIIGQPVQEGDTGVVDRSMVRTQKNNIFQIFKNEVMVSGTTKAIKSAGVPNEFNYQIAQRMLEIKRELAMSVLTGVKSAAGSDSVYRTMDGVRNAVRIGANTITTAEALSEGVVNSLATLIWNDGGEFDLAVGHESQMSKFAEMYRDKIRLAPSDRQIGRFITKFLTDKGVEIDLLTDRWAQRGDLLLLDSKRIALHTLQGRAMHMEPLAKVGDADRAMIIGEYSVSVRNAGESHALHSGLTA